jgi:O-antigen/teichoic acid export membrane protein
MASTLLSVAATIAAAVATHDGAIVFGAGALGLNVLTVVQIFAVPRGYRYRTLTPGALRLSRGDIGFGFGALLHKQVNTFVFSRSEVLFFGATQARERGTYASAQTIAARSTLLIDVFFGSIPTALASAHGRGQETLVRAFRRVSETVGILLCFFGPLLAVLCVTVAPVLFGQGFRGIAAPALALLVTSVLQSGMSPILTLQFAQRSIAPMLIGGMIAAGVDALIAVLLVPRWGIAGAVTANACAVIVYLSLCSLPLLRKAAWRSEVLLHIARSVITAAAVGLVALPMLWLPWWWGLLLGVPMAVLATAVLVRVPPIRPSPDVQSALAAAAPPRIRRPLAVGFSVLLGSEKVTQRTMDGPRGSDQRRG